MNLGATHWVWIVTGLVTVLLGYFVWRKLRRGRAAFTPFEDVPVRMVKVGDWEFRYHTSGRGPYMLLIHGIGANLFVWRYVLPLLSKHYTLIVPDLPGFGQSSKLKGAKYGLDEQVERLRAFLSQIGVSKTYVVGNSMGGNIALWFSLQFPKMILGTTVIAPATSPRLVPLNMSSLAFLAGPLASLMSRRAVQWAHRRTVSRKDLVGLDRIEETFSTYGRKGDAVRSFIYATEAIRDARMPGAFSELKTKVLILWGSKDNLVSRRVIDELETKLLDHESFVHVGGGHHLQEDEPDWVAEKIHAHFTAK